jgi:uncharacterized damage-inducible protein DinB
MNFSDLTDPQILDQYSQAAEKLTMTLAGLTEVQYNLRRAENGWSIRQILHHIIDSDVLVQTLMMAALGNSGCNCDQTWYPTDNSWAATLEYDKRPLAPALDLYRASHVQLLTLLQKLPDGLDRYVNVKIEKNPQWQKITVRHLLLSRLHHAAHHLQQIDETRQQHNI